MPRQEEVCSLKLRLGGKRLPTRRQRKGIQSELMGMGMLYSKGYDEKGNNTEQRVSLGTKGKFPL